MTPKQQYDAFEAHVKSLTSWFTKERSTLKGVFALLDDQLAKKAVKALKLEEIEKIVTEARPDGKERYQSYLPALRELRRVWGTADNYDAANLTNEAREKARVTTLKGDPSLFNQRGHGCCGPAAAAMALLRHNQPRFDALRACVDKGDPFLTIKDSEKITLRVWKRVAAGMISEDADNALDVRLAVGLMILLKMRLESSSKKAVWDACKAYSQLWESDGWQYGKKGEVLTFGYKHGDLALTTEATQELLALIGMKDIKAFDLISNDDLTAMAASLKKKEWDKIKKSDKFDFKEMFEQLKVADDAFVGVSKLSFLQDDLKDKAAPYDHIAHWVYLPKQAVPKTPFETVTFTWGGKLSFTGLLEQRDPVYVPRKVLFFKK